jgi:hypothetical protein
MRSSSLFLPDLILGDFSLTYKSSSIFLFAESEPDWVYLFTTVTTDGSGALHADAPSCFS